MKELSGIACMEDFYKKTCLIGLCQQGIIADVQQLWMNDKQAIELENICLANIKQDKRYKHYSSHEKEIAVMMDWLNFSPVSVEYVPENEIWIWAPEHYKIAMDEYRQWYKNNPIKEI